MSQTYFFPWVRKGIGLHISQIDNLSQDCSNSLVNNRPTITVSAKICGHKDKAGKEKETRYESKEISIAGPGDILNITTKAIKHVFPEPSNGTIVENNLPYIEFWEPDFAWRYTPACANEDNLRPWIALVICEEGKYRIEQNKVTFVADSEEEYRKIFPDPKEIYKSAHAQGDSKDEANFCRILCLGGSTFKEEDSIFGTESAKYFKAFLIPVFEVGRLRGLGYGEDILDTISTQASAWEESWAKQKEKKDSLVFPFYYSWTLQPKGKSFNRLVQELKPNNDVEDGIHIDVTSLGKGLSCKSSETPQKNGTICMPAALGPTSDNLEEAFPSQGTNLYKNLKNLLSKNPVFSENKEIINGISYNAEKDNEDPWIVPPIYGAKHVLATSLESNDTPSWLKQINLDLHQRAAAGLGKKIVQRHQEEFVHRAWEQVEFVKSVNADLNQKMLSVNVQKSVQKHNYKWLESEADKKKLLARLIMNLPLMRDVGIGNDENSSSSISKILAKKGISQSLTTTSFIRRTRDTANRSNDRITTKSVIEHIADSQIYEIPKPQDLITAPTSKQISNSDPSQLEIVHEKIKEKLLKKIDGLSPFRIIKCNEEFFGKEKTAFSIKKITEGTGNATKNAVKLPSTVIHPWNSKRYRREDYQDANYFNRCQEKYLSSFGWIRGVNNSDYGIIALEGSIFKAVFPALNKPIVKIKTDKGDPILFVNRDEAQQKNSKIKNYLTFFDYNDTAIEFINKDDWSAKALRYLCPKMILNEAKIYLDFLYNLYYTPTYIRADYELIKSGHEDIIEDYTYLKSAHDSLVDFWKAIESIKKSNEEVRLKNPTDSIPESEEIDSLLKKITSSFLDEKTLEEIKETITYYWKSVFNIEEYKASLSTSKYPIIAYPIFPEPTYLYLKIISDEFILPGIDNIENNTISMFKNNPAFIESFLCGMNTEMGRELLWREYPTDQRGSYFRKFWDADTNLDNIKDKDYFDVESLHDWENDIGHNHLGNKGNLLVFAIRGDLMKAYPDTKITLRKAYYDATADNELKLATHDDKPDNTLVPTSQAFIRDDIYIVGFNISTDDAIGTFNTDSNINSGYFLSFEKSIENTEFKAKASPSSNLSNAVQFAIKHLEKTEIYNIHVSTLISE